jgi:NAD(P)-dependent dehydrogenase (short-subunit alcohol dehydrogenase family)
VVVADVLDGSAVAARIGAAGGEAIFCKADVTSAQSLAALVAATLARFGTIDVLVNNASSPRSRLPRSTAPSGTG